MKTVRIRAPYSRAIVIVSLLFTVSIEAQQVSPERQLVIDAANAMGGVDRLLAVETLTLRGYGHEAYQDGGSRITTAPEAPEKMTNLTAYERVIDLVNDRTRVRARGFRAFVFAAESMMRGQPREQSLDGNVAYDGARRQSDEVAMHRRMEMLANPLVALRAALEPESTLRARRYEGPNSLVDVDVGCAKGGTYGVHAAREQPGNALRRGDASIEQEARIDLAQEAWIERIHEQRPE